VASRKCGKHNVNCFVHDIEVLVAELTFIALRVNVHRMNTRHASEQPGSKPFIPQALNSLFCSLGGFLWRRGPVPEFIPDPTRKAAKGTFPSTPLSLLERVRANDQDAWRGLLALYQPLVRYWCTRSGLAPEDVEDATQEVFAATAKAMPSFRRDRPGDTFRGWLRGITRNQIFLFHRRSLGKATATGGSEALSELQQIQDPVLPGDEDETHEISQLYKRALERIRCEFEERTWLAFWLTVITGRAAATLTTELGMSIAAIRQAKSRVLRRIKLEVGDLLD
jgi:RNA polymerase sigma-70 factor (ECF subfamily)